MISRDLPQSTNFYIGHTLSILQLLAEKSEAILHLSTANLYSLDVENRLNSLKYVSDFISAQLQIAIE